MNPHPWSDVESLFLAVVEREPIERRTLLDRDCVGAPALRAEVEALLAEHDQSSSFMETPAFELADMPGEPAAAMVELGRCIGPYRITGIIATGGMGIVYEAEQQNPRRAVAVKVLRGGPCLDDTRVRLFEREVQSLARLRHPAIAAIHEAGRTDEGDHYFAMELIHGESVDAYVRRRLLSLRQRLELFCRICEGVAYAHQRGVIHRDLKPANILIVESEYGESPRHGGTQGPDAPARAALRAPAAAGAPKILDFGLARIMDADVSMTLATAVGRIQGTLAYMSPEQARGDPDAIDVRSDVYSLGVILFELLTGQLPYDAQRAGLPDALRVICEQPPRRPGTLVRALRGDLETIVLKALEKDPDRRYSSATALIEDVERYLSSQPILARPPSAVYQIRKLVSRHRAVSALCAALVLLLATFGATASLYAARLAEQNRRTSLEQEATLAALRQADEIGHFMERMLFRMVAHRDESPVGPNDPALCQLYDALQQTIEHDLDGQPGIEALVHERVANVLSDLGLYEDAEKQMQRGLELREGPPADTPAIISALYGLANLSEMMQAPEKRAMYLDRAQKLAWQTWPDGDVRTAILARSAARYLRERGDWPAAAERAHEADEIYQEFLAYLCPDCRVTVRSPPTTRPTDHPPRLKAVELFGACAQPQAVAIDPDARDLVVLCTQSPSRCVVVRAPIDGHLAPVTTKLREGEFARLALDRFSPQAPYVLAQYNRLLRYDAAGSAKTIAAGPPVVCISGVIQDLHSGPGAGDFIVSSVWPHYGFEPPQSRAGLFRITTDGAVSAVHSGAPFVSPGSFVQDIETGEFIVPDVLVDAVFRVSADGRVRPLALGPPLVGPVAVVQDDRTHDFIVADGTSRTVAALYRISRAGDVTPIHIGPPLQEPRSIVQDSVSGDLFVADQHSATVWRVKAG